jgi:hypothetical protein
VAHNGFADFPGTPVIDPIQTRVSITTLNGRMVVSAAGTLFPSLAVYQDGADGRHLRYWYHASALGLAGRMVTGDLPNMVGK